MKVSLVTKPKKNAPLVFFLFNNEDIAKHLLAGHLEKEEKQYLQVIKKELAVKEKEAKAFVLPKTARKVIVVGLGKEADFTAHKAGLATRLAVQAARKEKLASFAFKAAAMRNADETKNFFEVVAANAVMANFEFVKYKTPPPEGFVFIKEIEAVAAKPDANIKEGLRRGSSSLNI